MVYIINTDRRHIKIINRNKVFIDTGLSPPEDGSYMDFRISETYVKVFVVIFSLVGVGVLVTISNFSQVEEVPISRLGDHIGDEVSCVGSVVGAVHYDIGSARILIADGMDLLEIYVERSSREVKPGDRIRTTGELFGSRDNFRMTVDSDRGIEVTESKTPLDIMDSSPGSICSLTGTVSTCRPTYDDGFQASVYRRSGEDLLLYEVTSRENGEVPRSGSTINITGLLSGNNSVISFGHSMEIISQPDSTDSTLESLVEEMSQSPAGAPLYPMDISAYVIYEPMGTSLYVSEAAQGGSISIRVNMPQPSEMIHKGDLVELINSTLSWIPEKARYELNADTVRVTDPHGPWMLNLEALEWGVSEFEGCQVVMEGQIEKRPNATILKDGEYSIRLKGYDHLRTGEISTVTGEIVFDPEKNIYLLDSGDSV